MMKKFIALMLAMTLALLPMASLADGAADAITRAGESGRAINTTATLSIAPIPGAEDAMSIVNDVLGALAFTGYTQPVTNQAGFAVQLSGADVLTVDAQADNEVFYVTSNLLGGDVVRMNPADIQTLSTTFYDAMLNILVSNGQMTSAQAAQAKAEFLDQMTRQMNQPNAADFDFSSLTMTNTLAAINSMSANMTTEEATSQPNSCDPAAIKVTFTMTGEQLVDLLEAVFTDLKASEGMMSFLTSFMTSAGQHVEDVPALLDQAIAELRNADGMADFTQPVTLYLNEDGEVVYAETTSTQTDSEGAQVTVAMEFARLTMNDGVHYAFNITGDQSVTGGNTVAMNITVVQGEGHDMVSFVASQNGIEVLHVSYVADVVEQAQGSTGAGVLELSLTDSNTHQNYTVNITVDTAASWTENDVMIDKVYKLFFMGSDEALATVNVHIESGSARPALNTADAVKPSEMSESEMNAWFQQVGQYAQMALVGVLQHLPESVLQMMMQQN